jgi:hypothetical protein
MKIEFMKRLLCYFPFLFYLSIAAAQVKSISLTKGKYADGPDSIAPVGIIKGLTDDQLMETVQKQTFVFSGTALTL